MKAYKLFMRNDDDAGAAIVFASTGKEARKQIFSTDLADYAWDFINIGVRRYPDYDGMEELTKAELALQQWKNGWLWFEIENPDPDTASDEEFLQWYVNNFKPVKND